jgi:hypothetical protein
MPDEIKREIEELLDKLDNFVPEESPVIRMQGRWSMRFRRWRRDLTQRLSRISPGHVMVASLLLIVVAYIFRSAAFAEYALIAGIVLLFSTIVVSFFTAQRPKQRQEKRWRGQVVDLSEPSLGDRMKGWFSRKRRGRRY